MGFHFQTAARGDVAQPMRHYAAPRMPMPSAPQGQYVKVHSPTTVAPQRFGYIALGGSCRANF